MKVLNLQEPWASLVKEGCKRIETRSWRTNYRGELYIHASQRKLTAREYDLYVEQLGLLRGTEFVYGAIIAKCRLVDCRLMTGELIAEVKKDRAEFLCGEYKPGRYAWILEDVEALEMPIPAKGQLGIWTFEQR